MLLCLSNSIETGTTSPEDLGPMFPVLQEMHPYWHEKRGERGRRVGERRRTEAVAKSQHGGGVSVILFFPIQDPRPKKETGHGNPCMISLLLFSLCFSAAPCLTTESSFMRSPHYPHLSHGPNLKGSIVSRKDVYQRRDNCPTIDTLSSRDNRSRRHKNVHVHMANAP